MKVKNIFLISLCGLLILSGCSTTGDNQQDNLQLVGETNIVLSDDQITVNGSDASTSEEDAVYISHDIIYYEDKDTYESGNAYGEGSDADKHTAEEANQHTVVNITEPGTYRISGSLSYGQIFVDLGDEAERDENAKVTLVLDNVDITCTVAPAIFFYRVYESDTEFIAYDEGELEEYTANPNQDTTKAGANVVIADGSENNIEGSYVARIYKDNEEAKKLHKYDGAFYSRMTMNVDGNDGVLNITAENEGLNSERHLTIHGGKINITAENDGINTNEDGVSVTTINGGSLHIVAGLGEEGDGIDSNGYLMINGGTVIAIAKPQADSGLDSDLGSFINGGYVLATGSTMDWPESDSNQVTINLQFANMQNNDEAIIITDMEDQVLFAYDPDKDETTGVNNRQYQGAVISSPEFSVGDTYHIYLGGEIEGEEVDGLYDVSTVTSFTGATQQTNAGLATNMGRPGGMMPGGNFDDNAGEMPNGFDNFTADITVDEEIANGLLKLMAQVNPDSAVTKEDLMACTNIMDLMSLAGFNHRDFGGNRGDMNSNGEVPEMPQGGMGNPMENQANGDIFLEFEMTDKVNTFANITDKI